MADPINLNFPKPGQQMPAFVKYLFVVFVVLFLLSFVKPFVTIGPGLRGVVMNFGAVQDIVMDEGFHFLIPVVQKVQLVDVRIQKSQTEVDAASKDLQQISSTIALNFQIIPEKANVVFQELGPAYKERIIDPAVQEMLKAVAARYTAEELITKREQVKNETKELLTDRLLESNIRVVDFSIVNFAFSNIFTAAIEAKQEAEQFVGKATRDLQRIEIEAKQKVAAARAEAEALKIQREVLSKDLIELRRIEASLKAIEKWDGRMPSVTGGAVPFIDPKSFK